MNNKKAISNFLPHIQGLRGVAILLVFLFHLCPGLCPNGYYGVDLFYVISGYFLLKNRFDADKDFSILEFCRKKLIRLLPPIFFVIALVMLLSICFLPAREMIFAFTDAKFAILLSSNVQLSQGTNTYFSADVRSLSLMHLWYICVLIQALAFFAMLFFVWSKLRVSKAWRIASLALVGILSLMVHLQYIVHAMGWGDVSFAASTYSWTTARVWEIAAGGMLTLLPAWKSNKYMNALPMLALAAMVVLSFCSFEISQKLIPLMVVLSLVLVAGGGNGAISHFLQINIFSVLGKYSYSLYLVHWPIIWMSEYLFGATLSFRFISVTLVAVVCFTLFVYHWLEKPKFNVWKSAVVVGSAPALALAIIKTGGFKDYIRVEKNKVVQEGTSYELTPVAADSEFMKDSNRFLINLWGRATTDRALMYHLGQSSQLPTYVLLGDSHANHFKEAFDYHGKTHGWSGIFLNSYMTAFYGSNYSEVAVPDHTNTPEKHDVFIDWLKRHHSIQYVVIAQWWSNRYIPHSTWKGKKIEQADVQEARTEQLRQFCQRVKDIGKQVIVIADTPSIATKNPSRIARHKVFYGDTLGTDMSPMQCTEACHMQMVKDPHKTFATLQQEGMCHVLYPHRGLMENGTFSAFDGKSLLMSDNNHLYVEGAKKALIPFCSEISKLLAGESSH